MIRLVVVLLSLGFVAGCGADGEPVRPALNAGVAVTSDGVYPTASVSVNKGPVWLGLSL